MNKAIIYGRLTKDVEIKNTNNNNAVAQFTVAVDRAFKDAQGNRQTDFISCVAWRKTAEIISKYFHKGSPILVEGEIQTRTYKDKDDKTVYVTEIVVSNFDFSINDNNRQTEQAPAPVPTAPATPTIPNVIEDDELPFEV